MYKLRLLLPLSGIPTCPLNSVYCCSHLMPNLSLKEAGMDSPLVDASLIASADIAPIPLVYPSADSSLLASVDIAPIPLMYPSADADILASAAIAPIPLMYPLMSRYECKCDIVNSSILLGLASDWKIAYWKISFLYLVK